MSKPPADHLEILCPDCHAMLIVDRSTGTVLEHRSAKGAKNTSSFEDAFAAMKTADQSREDRFRVSVESQKRRAEELSKQFEHLVKKASEEDDGTPPPNPLDLD